MAKPKRNLVWVQTAFFTGWACNSCSWRDFIPRDVPTKLGPSAEAQEAFAQHKCAGKPGKGVMGGETRHSELMRLRKVQIKAQQNETYGGLSKQERSEYNSRAERIHELNTQVQPPVEANRRAADQRRDWNKESETDTTQSEARQPYRVREQDSTKAFTDKWKTRRTNQKHNPEDGG